MAKERLARDCADSVARRAEAKAEVASALEPSRAARRLNDISSPGSASRAVRKAGVALIVAPDPFTTVTGAVMVASSYALKGREPASLMDIAQATRKALRDLGSLSL